MPREAQIVSAIVKEARRLGWWVHKNHGNPFVRAGIPDLLCLRDGRAVFLEVKQPGRKPTPIQIRTMAEIESTGGARCHVVTSKEEIHAHLRTDTDGHIRTTDDPARHRSEQRSVQ
jgi:hypothetical protein